MLTINSDKLKIEVRKHIEMEDGRRKGGFIGCLAHSNDIRFLAEKYGFAPVFVRLVENIFGKLPQAKRVQFFSDLGENMRDGVDTEMVTWTVLRQMLERVPDAPEIATVIDLLKRVEAGEDRNGLRDEFRSAADVPADAADAAAFAAAFAALAACSDAAFAAADAAYAAASAAASAAARVVTHAAEGYAAYAAARAAADAAERDQQAADVIAAIKNARCSNEGEINGT